MSNYDDIKLLIKHTTGQENILGVNKVYMKYMGSLEGGVLLSQLIYYSDKSSRSDGYFWKSYKEWYDETFISEHNIKKIVSKMKELGFIETKLIKANAAPTIHYRIDMDKFTELFIPFLKILRIDSENIKNGNLKNSESITKSTTENTNKEKDIKKSSTISSQISEIESQFETWWNTYGKKLAKPKALASFKRVVKKHGYPKLLEQTMQYVEPFVKGQKDRQYQQHPQTFLNAYDPDNDYTPQKGGYKTNEGFKRADDVDSFKERFGVEAPF